MSVIYMRAFLSKYDPRRWDRRRIKIWYLNYLDMLTLFWLIVLSSVNEKIDLFHMINSDGNLY